MTDPFVTNGDVMPVYTDSREPRLGQERAGSFRTERREVLSSRDYVQPQAP